MSVFWIGVGWTLDRVLGLPDYVSLMAFVGAGVVTHGLMRFGDPGTAPATPAS